MSDWISDCCSSDLIGTKRPNAIPGNGVTGSLLEKQHPIVVIPGAERSYFKSNGSCRRCPEPVPDGIDLSRKQVKQVVVSRVFLNIPRPHRTFHMDELPVWLQINGIDEVSVCGDSDMPVCTRSEE